MRKNKFAAGGGLAEWANEEFLPFSLQRTHKEQVSGQKRRQMWKSTHAEEDAGGKPANEVTKDTFLTVPAYLGQFSTSTGRTCQPFRSCVRG